MTSSTQPVSPDEPIHIAHLVWHFSTGGLENGMVNLINNLAPGRFRHSIITLTGHDPVFASRIKTGNVQFYNLQKAEGHDWRIYSRLNSLLKSLSPDVLHSRNITAFELQLVGWWRKVPLRIHGEHGWDTYDVAGTSKKYQWLRRLLAPFVHQFIVLSSELEQYLLQRIKIHPAKITRICNGVDIARYDMATAAELPIPKQANGNNRLLFGTVGRLADIKNQAFLLTAFARLLQQHPEFSNTVHLLIVGDGPNKESLQQLSHSLDIADNMLFTGNRADIPELMQLLDVFVLPSLAEGISNTILEAMASGTAVIATKVGGNADLLPPALQVTNLVEVNNIDALVGAMLMYLKTPYRLTADALVCKNYCRQHFSIANMVQRYQALYEHSGTQE